MSWLARSIADTLRLDDEEEDAVAEAAAVEGVKKPVDDSVPRPTPNDTLLREDRPRDSAFSIDDRRSDSDGGASDNQGVVEDVDVDYDQGRGVKEDLSEFRESLTRQFWGVASFLAPPPPPPPPPPLNKRSSILSKSDSAGSGNADEEEEEELAEYDDGQLGESANFSPSTDYDAADTLEDAVGITEEVLAFARNIAHHPETWLDFPIEEEEFDDFDISDAQYKHALAIEHLAPRLAALRFELCPVHMGVGYFWMVYFVLLHSRLNKHDANLLSTQQLVQARAMWLNELQKQTKGDSYWSGISTFQSKGSTDSPRENAVCSYEEIQYGNESDWRSVSEASTHQMTTEHEIEKHVLDEVEFVDKSVIKEDPPPKLLDKEIVVGSSVEMPEPVADDDDDDDDWLKDDSDLIGYTGSSLILNEDDISFSDLEDDLDSTLPYKYKTSSSETKSATKTP